MADVDIVDASIDHIPYLAENMREADRRELEAMLVVPEYALVCGINESAWAKTVIVEGRPALMFGVSDTSILSGIGIPWLLGTDDMERMKVTFIRQCRWFVLEMLRSYPVLVNYVDARNATSIRWLTWLGFTLDPAEPHGFNGELFHRFEMRAA